MAHHILHGQFVNPKGGEGNENDKGVLKAICGNKTLKAVQRSTSSS